MKKILTLGVILSAFLWIGCGSDNQADPVDPMGGSEFQNEEESGFIEGEVTEELEDIKMKISYPEEWGEANYHPSYMNAVSFSNLAYKRKSDGVVLEETVFYEGNNFIVTVFDYNRVIDLNDNFVGGGESTDYHLEYFDYMKNKLVSFDGECKKTLKVGACAELERISVGNEDYLSYINFGWQGVDFLNKKWVRFFDDKVILVRADLRDIAGDDFDKVFNKIFEEQGGAAIATTNSHAEDYEYDTTGVEYADFGVDPEKLKELDDSVESFLSSIKFESTNSKKEIDENLKRFQKYIDGLTLSEETKSPEVLSELSKSEFIKVRRNVASNQNTPVNILEELANDSSNMVKVSVKFNPNTPRQIADGIVNPF